MRRVGADRFRYVYAEPFHAERASMGWSDAGLPAWCMREDASARELAEADVLYTGLRCLDLMERRAARGLKTFYYSERWFKPVEIGVGCRVPGWVRMLVPSYRKMAKRLVTWLKTDPNARYLAVGPWAAKDMIRLGVPAEKIIPWGYFVAPSTKSAKTIEQSADRTALNILYVGRLLALKRVDTIIKAVRALSSKAKAKGAGELKRVSLTVVGEGPVKGDLVKLAQGLNNVTFRPFVPIDQVRDIMRQHDVVVFSSNGDDGWGAVVNEALEEGVPVIGTYETGASAALLPESNLFHCGDSRGLAKRLLSFRPVVLPRAYTAAGAAERMLAL